MDLLDVMTGRFFQTFSGRYYPKLPPAGAVKTLSDASDVVDARYFDYEVIDPETYNYRQLLQNLIDKDGAELTIKTGAANDYRIGGYVALSNGNLYTILSITRDVRAASKQAAEFMPIPIGTEYILRLASYVNPRGL